MTKRKLVFTFVLLLGLVFTNAVFAQEEPPEILVCSGEQVTGTLVDFNTETNTATINTGTELCTVTFKQDYGNPITTLLGNYFGTFNLGGFSEALQATQVCVVQDETTLAWSLVQPANGEDCPGTLAKVTGQNEDGTFQLVLSEGEEISLMIEDEGTATGLASALETLMVAWGLNEDSSVTNTGDEIAQYHEDGFGFGVIVKVYGMAMASQESCGTEDVSPEEGASLDEETPVDETSCGLNVADLFQALKEGTSVGQLFKLYGKPALLGVGHVRKNSVTGEEGTLGATGSLGTSGICNARSHGGNANAKGQGNIDCGDTGPAELDKNKDKIKTNNGKPPKNNKGD